MMKAKVSKDYDNCATKDLQTLGTQKFLKKDVTDKYNVSNRQKYLQLKANFYADRITLSAR